MNTGINYPALAVLIALFLLVTVMGFWASNWRRGEHLASLDEWGLGGRTFGTWMALSAATTSLRMPRVFGIGESGPTQMPS